MKKITVCFLMVILLIVFNISLARAVEPEDTLKRAVNGVLTVLGGSETDAVKDAKIWKIIKGVFDFRLMSSLVVGKYYWRGATFTERKEFTEVFTQLLGNIYIKEFKKHKKVRVEFKGQKLTARGKSISKFLVKTRIVSGDGSMAIEVNYKMYTRKGKTKVYDIEVVGVSMIITYRSQYKEVLKKHPLIYLIREIRKMI